MSRLTEQNSFVRVNSLSLLRGNAVKVWNFHPRTGGWLPNLRFAVSRTWACLSTLAFAAGFWVRGEKPSIVTLWDNAAAKSPAFNSRTFLAAPTNDARRTARKTCHNAANFFFFSTIAASVPAVKTNHQPLGLIGPPISIPHPSEGTPLNLLIASAAMLLGLTGSRFAFKYCKWQSSCFWINM